MRVRINVLGWVLLAFSLALAGGTSWWTWSHYEEWFGPRTRNNLGNFVCLIPLFCTPVVWFALLMAARGTFGQNGLEIIRPEAADSPSEE